MREADRVHLAGLALVLLEGREHLRIRRPHYDRVFAMDPTSIVGCIPVIFHAIRGELLFSPGSDLAHPQVPIAEENCPLSIWREIGQRGVV